MKTPKIPESDFGICDDCGKKAIVKGFESADGERSEVCYICNQIRTIKEALGITDDVQAYSLVCLDLMAKNQIATQILTDYVSKTEDRFQTFIPENTTLN